MEPENAFAQHFLPRFAHRRRAFRAGGFAGPVLVVLVRELDRGVLPPDPYSLAPLSGSRHLTSAQMLNAASPHPISSFTRPRDAGQPCRYLVDRG